MSKVLITGSEGFVGKALTKKFFDLGYNREDLYLKNDIPIDLKDQYMVNKFFKFLKPTHVFSLAARVGGIQDNIRKPYDYLYDNLMIQNNIIEASLNNNVKKVLFLGSSCIYPKDYNQPLKEEYLLNASLEPTNEGYALAKIAGLKLCEYANKQFNKTKFVSLMPCNLYGPGDCFDLSKAHVLSSLVKKIVDANDSDSPNISLRGKGTPRREFLYIDDLVNCMLWAMIMLDKTETFLNVGTGKDISIMELAKLIAKLDNYEGDILETENTSDGMLVKKLDVSKINNLGWSSKTTFEIGIKKTIEYYRKMKGDKINK